MRMRCKYEKDMIRSDKDKDGDKIKILQYYNKLLWKLDLNMVFNKIIKPVGGLVGVLIRYKNVKEIVKMRIAKKRISLTTDDQKH